MRDNCKAKDEYHHFEWTWTSNFGSFHSGRREYALCKIPRRDPSCSWCEIGFCCLVKRIAKLRAIGNKSSMRKPGSGYFHSSRLIIEELPHKDYFYVLAAGFRIALKHGFHKVANIIGIDKLEICIHNFLASRSTGPRLLMFVCLLKPRVGSS